MPKPSGRPLKRNAFFYRVFRALIIPFSTRIFRLTADPQPALPPPYIVISNHVTELDFFILGKTFKKPMVFVANEALFRKKWLRKFLVFCFSPILKRKGAADTQTTLGILRTVRQGGCVCLFAEGNTPFDGRTGGISPAAGTLVKALKAGLVTYRIQGGSLSMPRWGSSIRRGRVRGIVAGQYPPETLGEMSASEINRLIFRDLQHDDCKMQRARPLCYRGKRLAEGLENALYLCPKCHQTGTLKGAGDEVLCACGLRARYTETGFFLDSRPFGSVREWTDWQRGELGKRLAVSHGEPVLVDRDQTLCLLQEDHGMKELAEGDLGMGRAELSVGSVHIPMEDVAGVSIFRKNTLIFNDSKGNQYELVSPYPRSALKYRDLYELLQKDKD